MKILITGITGFIGKNLSNYLIKSKFDILGISREKNERNKFNILQSDLFDFSNIKDLIIDFNPDIIIHLAWFDINKLDSKNSKLNLKLSENFFDFVFKNLNCKKIIVTGSCLEYKNKKNACSENDELDLLNDFSKSKSKLKDYLSIKCKEFKIDFFWFRLFYVFGPYQKKTSLIPMLIDSIKNKKKLDILYPFNCNDFVPVELICKIIFLCIRDNIKSGIYNIGSGFSTKVLDIANILEKKILNQNNLTLEFTKNFHLFNDQPENYWSDNTKLISNFEKIEGVNIEKSIIKYLEYF